MHAGRTYTVYYLNQNYYRGVALQPDPQELILEFRPGMDASAVQALTFTAGGDTFDVSIGTSSTLNITPEVWQAGQMVAVGLRPTRPTPTPALPLAGVGILTLLLAVGARRRASRY